MIDKLPGLSALDVRQLEHNVSAEVVVGALVGYILGTLLNIPAQTLFEYLHVTHGPGVGVAVLVLAKLAMVYLALLVAARHA